MPEICLSGSMSGNRKQDQGKPDCGGKAKAKSTIHREPTVTAPVLDSTRVKLAIGIGYFAATPHSMPVIVLLNRPDGIGASRFQARNGPSLVILPVVFVKRPVPAVMSTEPCAWNVPVPATGANFLRFGKTEFPYRTTNTHE
jgi:hypothetical protein